jgi:predicted DCC family thiol-disulfide oxidoreductase YuxK
MEKIPTDKNIVLFDGVCNLCNASVRFIIKRDRKNLFYFASLQGAAGQELLRNLNLETDQFNSFVLIEKSKVFVRSEAVLRVLKILGGSWKFLYAFIILPKFIRDGIYNLIAKNRYKWFGKKEKCPVPLPEWKAKFLE